MQPDVNPQPACGVHRDMDTNNPNESTTPEPTPVRRLQNPGNLGVVTLDARGIEFVSRRPLNDAELAQAYAEHTARHGIV